MANVGDKLLQPESGWKRIDDNNLNFKYIGNWTIASSNSNYYNSTSHHIENSGDGVNNIYVEFYVYTSKILILQSTRNDYSSELLITVDGVQDNYSCKDSNVSVAVGNIVCYKRENMDKKVHHIKIKSNDNVRWTFDAIDIDEDGYMVYCDSNGKLYYDVTPIMTSNNTPSPYVVNYNSEHDINIVPGWKALNGYIGTTVDGEGWATKSGTLYGWLSLDFNIPTRMNCVKIVPRQGITNQCPVNFTIEGSNNGTSYDILKTITNFTDWTDDGKLFNLDKIANYRFYRISASSVNGGVAFGIGELRYLLAVDTPFYLIQDNTNGKKYSYDEVNNTLVEVTDTSVLNKDALNNTCIYDLSKVVPLLDTLSDDLTILCNNDKNVVVNGIKNNKELIIGKNSFSTLIAENIDYFKLDENATAKVIFSIDDGITWKTYSSDTQSFEDLNISIPLGKNYSDFTDEEKETWNEAKEIAYNQGIDSSILNTIDFNTLNLEKIRFGYVLSATDSETMDKMTNIIWQFDSKGVMELVDGDKVKQQLFYGGVKLISNIDADMLKVNITYEGISGDSGNITTEEFTYTQNDVSNIINSLGGSN